MKSNFQYIWGISQKKDGQMKIYPNDPDGASLNRKKFFDKLGLDANNVVSAGLIHGDNIVVVGKENIGKKIENTDGLITSIPNIILTITIADCLPIYFFDKNKGVIGLVHAGWRGVVNNIVTKTLKKMESEFGTNPNDVNVIIGPHIKDCHFEVGEDVAKQFAVYNNFIDKDGDNIKINLSGIVSEQLKNGGVNIKNISDSEDCTHCLNEKYYSFRRDKPEKVEAMMAYSVIVNI